MTPAGQKANQLRQEQKAAGGTAVEIVKNERREMLTNWRKEHEFLPFEDTEYGCYERFVEKVNETKNQKMPDMP